MLKAVAAILPLFFSMRIVHANVHCRVQPRWSLTVPRWPASRSVCWADDWFNFADSGSPSGHYATTYDRVVDDGAQLK